MTGVRPDTRWTLPRIGIIAVFIVLLVYVWAQRSGRYQVTSVADHVFVILDTTTGEHWIYGPEQLQQLRESGRLRHVYIDRGEGVGLLDRIRP
jgi:hypothetical protein